MKVKLMFILLATMGLFGCSEEHKNDPIEIDFAPISISFTVQDRAGNDLLSPQYENNILSDSIYIVYDNMKFPLGVDMSEQTQTRAYYAPLSGLEHSKFGNDYYFTFGSFNGDQNWDDTFEVHWGDGSSDKISFIRSFYWESDGSYQIGDLILILNNKHMDNLNIIR